MAVASSTGIPPQVHYSGGNKSHYPTEDEKKEVNLRLNLYELEEKYTNTAFVKKVKEQAKKVACFMKRHKLVAQHPSGYKFDSDQVKPLAETNKALLAQLTPGYSPIPYVGPFGGELSAADSTLFLITERHGLTAAHCLFERGKTVIDPAYLKKLVVAFNYHRETETQIKDFFYEDEVYEIDCVLDYDYDRTPHGWKDYAIVQLNKKVTCTPPFDFQDIAFDQPVKENDGIYVLGYSEGTPIKYVRDGKVRFADNTMIHQFQIEADTFRCNSGSPVFNFLTNKIIGMLIQGHPDYDLRPYKTEESLEDEFRWQVAIISEDQIHPPPGIKADYSGYEKCQRVTTLHFLKAILPSISISASTLDAIGHREAGLNLEGICTRDGCANRGQLFIIPCHLGKFDLNRLACKTYCPCCKKKILFEQINMIILDSCMFTIDAMNPDRVEIKETVSLLPGKTFRISIQDWHYFELDVKITK